MVPNTTTTRRSFAGSSPRRRLPPHRRLLPLPLPRLRLLLLLLLLLVGTAKLAIMITMALLRRRENILYFAPLSSGALAREKEKRCPAATTGSLPHRFCVSPSRALHLIERVPEPNVSSISRFRSHSFFSISRFFVPLLLFLPPLSSSQQRTPPVVISPAFLFTRLTFYSCSVEQSRLPSFFSLSHHDHSCQYVLTLKPTSRRRRTASPFPVSFPLSLSFLVSPPFPSLPSLPPRSSLAPCIRRFCSQVKNERQGKKRRKQSFEGGSEDQSRRQGRTD